MPRKKTHEEFVVEMSAINPNIEVLGKYVNGRTKILCRCKAHNVKWETMPDSLVGGSGCAECGKEKMRRKRSKTHKDFVAEMAEVNTDIEIIGKYKNQNKKILCRCKRDENEWEARPANLLRGTGCPVCGVAKIKKAQRKTQKQFEKELKAISPHIEIVGNYVNNKTKIECKCNKHNQIFSKNPQNLLRGQGCDRCSSERMGKAQRRSHDQFVRELKEVNSRIMVTGKYIKSSNKVECRCLIDNHTWEASPLNLLSGSGCPKCNASRGERAIENALKSKAIKFNYQHTFNDCKHKHKLHFDFYLPKLQTAIEYEGIQHFKPVDFFGGQPAFEQQLQRDAAKDRYCKENNIKLIRIPYTEESVEAYLKERLGEVAS